MPKPEVSIEAVVRSFFETLSAGDLESLGQMLHDDATWTIFAEGLPGGASALKEEAMRETFS